MTETVKVLGYEILPEAEVAYAFVDQPQPGQKKGQAPSYKVTLRYDRAGAQAVANQLEHYNATIDSMYPNTQRKTDWFKPETVSKTDKTLTGNFLLEFRNIYPVKVYDANNNLIDPSPRITRGSRVCINVGILPFEFNGTHGIARTRLYDVKIVEAAESASSNPFGAPVGSPIANTAVAPEHRNIPQATPPSATRNRNAPPPPPPKAPQVGLDLPDWDDDVPF